MAPIKSRRILTLPVPFTDRDINGLDQESEWDFPSPSASAGAFVGSNRGLEATYTEHGSITSEKAENRSKSWTCNHRELTLPPIQI